MRWIAEPDAAADTAADEELVRRVLAGRVGEFESLVRRHGRRVHRAVRAVLRSDEDVEDATQQTWLQAFAGLRAFEGASSFSTWITRIALNEALLRSRRARIRAHGGGEEVEGVAAPAGAGPEEETASREVVHLLERAVRDLPARYRAVVTLRHVEGLSTSQTAERLGITLGAVKLRLHRARLALRRAVDPGSARRPRGRREGAVGGWTARATGECRA